MATQGEATLGEAGSGLVWRSMARQGQQGEIPALCSKVGIMKYYTEARQGRARRGNARCGAARQGQQELRSCFIFNFHKLYFRRGRQGEAGHGMAWLGAARHGNARQGQQGQSPCFIFNLHKSITNYTLGTARSGKARHGKAWPGAVWHGEARAQGFKTLCIMRKK